MGLQYGTLFMVIVGKHRIQSGDLPFPITSDDSLSVPQSEADDLIDKPIFKLKPCW